MKQNFYPYWFQFYIAPSFRVKIAGPLQQLQFRLSLFTLSYKYIIFINKLLHGIIATCIYTWYSPIMLLCTSYFIFWSDWFLGFPWHNMDLAKFVSRKLLENFKCDPKSAHHNKNTRAKIQPEIFVEKKQLWNIKYWPEICSENPKTWHRFTACTSVLLVWITCTPRGCGWVGFEHMLNIYAI